MTKKDTLGIGLIGCGNISQAYFNGMKQFDVLRVVSCADLNMEAAQAKARENGCAAESIEALLGNSNIDLVVNLTVPAVHANISMAALEAGKHVHSEKPLAIALQDGRMLLDFAKERDLLVGCAPDTFMGAGLQTSRKIIDDGWIGKVTGGTAFLMSRGPEFRHPNPAFYQAGAGPLFDMGPYYITALIHFLGPVKRVSAMTSRAFNERIAMSKERYGERIPVTTPTHYSGSLEFHCGAVITITISFDVRRHGHSPIEIYGTEGSLKAPDPNIFGGNVELFTVTSGEWRTQAYSHAYADSIRGIGVADLAHAILSGRRHRANGDLAYHVLEVMHAFEKSSTDGVHVMIESKPSRPAPLPIGLICGKLD